MPWKNRQINKQLKSRVIITSNRDENQPCNSSLAQRRTYPPRFLTYDLYDRPYTGGGSVVLPGRNMGIIPRYHSKNLSKIKWPWVRHLNMSRWSLVKAFLPTAYWLYTFLKQSNTHLLTGDNHCFILIQYSYFCSQSRSKIVNKSTTTKPKYHLFFKSFCSSISITFSSFTVSHHNIVQHTLTIGGIKIEATPHRMRLCRIKLLKATPIHCNSVALCINCTEIYETYS